MRIAALDIGGTAIKAAIWENDHLWDLREVPTPVTCADDLLRAAEYIVREMGDVQAVGISTRGQVDGNGAILFDNGPISDYTGTQIKERLEAALGLPVVVENDVNCAAWAEAMLGAGKEHPDFLCVTYGTGIGGAIIQNGSLYHGANWSAGEFGAMQLFSQNPNGEGLCAAFYENLASASALVEQAQAVDTTIQSGRQVCARMDEPDLAPVIDRWVTNVSWGLSSLIHIFNPSLIVMGGGILQNTELFHRIHTCTKSQLMPGFEVVQLKQSQLGNTAGMIGAALLAEQILK